MGFSFRVDIPGDVKGALAKVKQAIVSKGGTFTGDERSGNFSGATPLGAIKGEYAVDAQVAEIKIVNSPFVVPRSTIESTIRKFFEG